MRLLPDTDDEVLGVADRWKAQHCHGGKWTELRSGDSEAVYQRLIALQRGATAKDVAEIVGNDSWVGERCDECLERDAIVLVGQEPDYESATVYLCAECVNRLVRLVVGGGR